MYNYFDLNFSLLWHLLVLKTKSFEKNRPIPIADLNLKTICLLDLAQLKLGIKEVFEIFR